jgi:hypothetical protein
MKYESNSKNDEALHQNASEIRIAFAFYRRACSRLSKRLRIAEYIKPVCQQCTDGSTYRYAHN